jgi:1,4-dihydroxy-2-naphthoyl-CoA hydrolase
MFSPRRLAASQNGGDFLDGALGGRILPLERTLDGTLGIEVLDHGEDVVRGRMPVSDRVRQPYGIVHGGAILALAESLTSGATAVGVFGDGKIAMGQEINASYMRPISEGHVNAEAHVRRKGRTAWNWEVEMRDDEGRLCTLVRLTIAVRAAPGGKPPEGPEGSPEQD